MRKISDRIVSGEAAPEDVDQLKTVADQIEGKTICAFGEACSWPTQSFVLKFKSELLQSTHLDKKGQPKNAEAIAQRRFLVEK
jgi:NADH-quinone oxidoreductase subunit F